MTTHRPSLRLALLAALAAAPFALVAQPVDPAVAPEADAAQLDDATTGSDLPTVADEAEGEVDRRCLKYTGSRTTADATPQTKERRRSVHERRRCAMATGTVYTREDIEGTGQVDLADALRTLDPRIQ